jgi:VanZ family protein
MLATNKQTLKKWKCVWLAWGGLIVVLSVLPNSVVLPSVSISDKILHAMFYIPMTLIPAVTFKRRQSDSLIKIGLVVFLMGVLLEIIQRYVPGRYFSYADMIANAAGLTAGVLLGLAWSTVASTVNGHRPF